MIASILLNRGSDGRYSDVIDVCEHLADTYGSAANALYQIAKESPLFTKGLRELSQKSKNGKAAKAGAA